MQNSTQKSLIKSIRSYIFLILITIFLLTSLLSIIDKLQVLGETKERIYTDTMNYQEELIKNEILIISNIISHNIDNNQDRNEVLDFLRKIRFGKNNDSYIFINTYDGKVILLDTQKELEGVNIWNLEDPNGIKVIQEERKAVEKPGGDFIYYSWEQPSTGKIIPKVSFIIGIPEWKWMVGTGVYLDSIEKEIAVNVKQIYTKLFINLAELLITMTILFLFIYFKFKHFTASVSKDISLIDECFKTTEIISESFDISKIKYNEFSIIAQKTNEMINRKEKAEKGKYYANLRLRLQQEQSPLAYVGWDLNNKIIEWNHSAENIFGYTKNEALGKGFELIIPGSEIPEVDNVFSTLTKTDNRKKHINQNITKSGKLITCEWYNNNLIDNNGKTLGIAAIGIDITRRLKTHEEIARKNIELEKSVKEKMVLIREVHHRVKNNMAIIASMLSLQSFSVKDDYLQTLLQSSQNRIQSMAMVHEHIYKNENLHDVNVRVYLTELIEYLMFSLGSIEKHISLNIEVEDINLDLDTLIPMGLLVNEIVSNSFKYAFIGDGVFELSVILRTIDENNMYFYIADNGPGFNFENNSVREGSIGLNLINGLVEQIDGRVKITKEGKTAYEIYF